MPPASCCISVMRRLIVSALCGAVLSACAAATPEPPLLLDLSANTCTPSPTLDNPTALSFDPKNEKVVTGSWGAGSACLVNAAGERSLYAVYAIPEIAGPYLVTVGSVD